MMCLAGLHISFKSRKVLSYLIGLLQIPIVLLTSFVGISGKHSEICINETKNSKKIYAGHSKHGKNTKNQCQYHNKLIQLIISISSCHKSVNFFSHVAATPFIYYISIIFLPSLSYFYLIRKSIKSILRNLKKL